MGVVHVTYRTDPAGPWSRAAAPVLRRIVTEFADDVRIAHGMGAPAHAVTGPHGLLPAPPEACGARGTPVDPRLWDGGPPRSTYPACPGVEATGGQAPDGRAGPPRVPAGEVRAAA